MNKVVKVQNFQERIAEKIKENIGDMITPDELKALVDKGIDEAFFKPAYKTNRYGTLEMSDRPLMSEIIEPILKEQVSLAVKQWAKGNDEKIQEVIKQCIDKSIVQTVTRIFDGYLQNVMHNFEQNIISQVRDITSR